MKLVQLKQNNEAFLTYVSVMYVSSNEISFGVSLLWRLTPKDCFPQKENQLDHVGELGSLYVLPQYQGQGVGSVLINAIVADLHRRGIDDFCLDSGYKRAQKRWLRKFGVPYKVIKGYWGPDNDHMIWLCKVIDFIVQ